MNIKDAKQKIESVIAQCDGDDKIRLSLAINALERSGGDYAEISPKLENLLVSETRLNSDKEKWTENVYLQALAMKRRTDCKNYLKKNKDVIDGETQSMWATIISALLGLFATAIVIVLTLLDVIDSVEIDDLAYIISLGGWAGTIIITVVCGFINKARVKKHDANFDYTVGELTVAKYEGSNALVKALLPRNIKNSFNKKVNIGCIHGDYINGDKNVN